MTFGIFWQTLVVSVALLLVCSPAMSQPARGSDLNLEGVTAFCLTVDIRNAADTVFEARAREIRVYLLDLSETRLPIPVEDCTLSTDRARLNIRASAVVVDSHYMHTLDVWTPTSGELHRPVLWGTASFATNMGTGEQLFRNVQAGMANQLTLLFIQWRQANNP